MQKIIPHLWYDTQAKEAAEFYTSIFPDSNIETITTIHNTPSGDADIVTFTIWGFSMMAISAGPVFKFNPSISFMVNFDPSRDANAKANLDAIWTKLMDGGEALMPLDKYPFSEWYGWVKDKYGVTWQLMLTNPDGEERPTIIPSIMFVGDNVGNAEKATDFYLDVFKNAPHANKETKRGTLAKYPAGAEPDKEGSVMFTDIQLDGVWLAAMDSAHAHHFELNEAISLLVECEDQAEIDYFWEKLSAVPDSEQCGWLKDKFGVSWQISPRELNTIMSTGSKEQVDRVTQAFLPMKKFDLAAIQKAYKGD